RVLDLLRLGLTGTAPGGGHLGLAATFGAAAVPVLVLAAWIAAGGWGALRWWSGRSSPERFDFYTRASLYGLFAAGPLVALALAGQKQVPGTRPDRLPAAVRGAGERLHRAAARQPVLLPGQGATAEEVAGGLSCRA